MKTDLDYLAKILNAFEQADTTFIDISSFPNRGIEYGNYDGTFKEEFIFHILIMIDNSLIGRKNGPVTTLKDVGVHLMTNGNSSFTSVPLRLTQKGHDFASSLSNKEVFAKLKTNLKDAPFKVLFEGGQRLLEHYLQKRLDAIIE